MHIKMFQTRAICILFRSWICASLDRYEPKLNSSDNF